MTTVDGGRTLLTSHASNINFLAMCEICQRPLTASHTAVFPGFAKDVSWLVCRLFQDVTGKESLAVRPPVKVGPEAKR